MWLQATTTKRVSKKDRTILSATDAQILLEAGFKYVCDFESGELARQNTGISQRISWTYWGLNAGVNGDGPSNLFFCPHTPYRAIWRIHCPDFRTGLTFFAIR